MPIAQYLSLSNEHYTPPYIIDAARATMGSIDLDPASNSLANTIVQATTYYTINDNGLSKSWHGNVFLNPPGGTVNGRSNQQIWLEYARCELDKGNAKQLVFISFNIESLRICGSLLRNSLVCIPFNRLRYYSEYQPGVLKEGNWNSKNKWTNAHTHTSCIYYFGYNSSEFINNFQTIGYIFTYSH